MKKITTILFIFCFTLISNAQDLDLKRANKYFDRAFYSEAIPLYENLFKDSKTFKTVQNLADCHYYLYNMEKASNYYKYLLKNYSSIVSDEYYFKYAHTLKAINKHKEANIALSDYYSKREDDENLSKLNQSIRYLENVKAIGNRYKIKNLAINTVNSEFGAIQKGNKLVFSATKKESSVFDKLYRWNGLPYLDLYEIDINKIHLGDSVAKSLSLEINTKVHEANATFTKDGKTIFFTRNNFVKNKRKKDSKKVTHVQIFKAELEKGIWTNIQSLPFNNDAYSTEHPSLSLDEKTLYFASDMTGGYGSFDIYSVPIFNDGSFGEPENLGKTINTEKKEQFPFITQNNELYFSSNGHPGFGSLDVFVSTITNNKFSKPDNIGLPVNSGYDDFSFTIDFSTKEGYFSSNRPGGKGNDDIYKIIEEKPLIIEDCKQSISGTITDIDTNKALANALISISKNEKHLDKIYTDVNGTFSLNAECEASYVIIASKDGYEQKQKKVTTSKERNKNHDASLALKSIAEIEKEKRIALELKMEEKKKLKIIADTKLKLANKEKAKQNIENKKAKIEKAIADEENIQRKDGKIIIKTDQLNFDYKLWYLRRDAKKEIDKVIALMEKYPDMIVEIGTHSDIRGNSRYNLELSQKRATSARMYIMEKGIEPDRISAIGYGENQPLIKCKTEESCSEEQHELNRRCEFVIKKIY